MYYANLQEVSMSNDVLINTKKQKNDERDCMFSI